MGNIFCGCCGDETKGKGECIQARESEFLLAIWDWKTVCCCFNWVVTRVKVSLVPRLLNSVYQALFPPPPPDKRKREPSCYLCMSWEASSLIPGPEEEEERTWKEAQRKLKLVVRTQFSHVMWIHQHFLGNKLVNFLYKTLSTYQLCQPPYAFSQSVPGFFSSR